MTHCTPTNSLTKNEIEGKALQMIDDSKAFQNLSLNGRYSLKHRSEFKALSEKYSREACLFMSLVFKWSEF